MSDKDRYTLTVYVAAPGTPLLDDFGDGRGYVPTGETSTHGHMYYVVSDGKAERSYGFAPREEGDINGPGGVKDTDLSSYRNPHYSRTVEVTAGQFKALDSFGRAGMEGRAPGFDSEYRDARNNCVDFTWAALRHAGIYRGDLSINLPGDRYDVRLKPFEGSLKPMDNIDDVRDIKAPFPNSELNQETRHPMPSRNPLQRLLSEDGLSDPAHPLHKDFTNIRSGVAAMDAAANKPRDAHSANMEASLLRLAVQSDIRADWAMLGIATEHLQAGKNVFVGQGEPTAQPRRWMHMDTQAAINTPAEDSFKQVATLQAERVQTAQLASAQSREPNPETDLKPRTV